MGATLLAWKPRLTTHEPLPGERQWRMGKEQWQIDCRLQACGEHGWETTLLFNGHRYFSCRFESRTLAAAAADEKRTELERDGWSLLPDASVYAWPRRPERAL